MNWRTVKRIVIERTGSAQKHDSKTGPNKSPSIRGTPSKGLSSGQIKVIYKELDHGANPAEIAKKYGISLTAVGAEYETYCRFRGSPDLRDLSRKLLDHAGVAFSAGLKGFEEKVNKNGFLTVEEIMELLTKSDSELEAMQNRRRDEGMLFPSGWKAIGCQRCRKLIASVNPHDATGATFLSQVQHGRHECGGQLGPHNFFPR